MQSTFIQRCSFRILFTFMLSVLFSSIATAANFNVEVVKSYSAKFKSQQPIDVNLDVNGVKLDSVFFDAKNLQAFLILRNRTPVSANPTIGIALFDKNDELMATGIDTTGFSFTGDSISPGEQKNVKLSFDKFLNDFKSVTNFKLVYSLGDEGKEIGSGSSSKSDDDF